ncbi:MAG: alpha/beta fold hydrolase, partial [Panacagrimonas sp.]
MITSSRSDFLIVRGLRYHVRIWGAPDAPPLFLLHGFMDTSATFDPVASILAEERRILAPDWRGFGLTEWAQDGYWFPEYLADLEAIVEHYASGSPFDMAGHSMGGQAAALFAGLRPDRVKRLALLDSLMLADQKANTAVDRYRRWMDEVRKPTRAPTYASFDQLAGRIRAKHPKLTPEGAAFVARCWG